MRNKARSTLALTLALTLAGSAGALAAGPLRGKSYVGSTPSSGVGSERHHRVKLNAGGNIILRVAGNGRSVTVRFSSSSPLIYCNTTKTLQVQSTKATRISGSGTFRASISERFLPGPGLAPIVQVVSGHFSGRTVSGTIETKAGECSGVTSFSARAR